MTETNSELNPSRGLFIVLDGLDVTSGKIAQCELLKRYLEEKGLPVVFTRDGSSRNFHPDLDPIAQTLEAYAYRRGYLTRTVQPNLDNGVTVITDYFEASTYTELGWVRDIDKGDYGGLSFELSRYVVQKCRPDVNVILDINPELVVPAPLDRYERDRAKLIEGYREYGQGFLVGSAMYYSEYADTQIDFVNGMRSAIEVHQDIVGLVEKKFEELKAEKLFHSWMTSYRDRTDLPAFPSPEQATRY